MRSFRTSLRQSRSPRTCMLLLRSLTACATCVKA